MTSSFLVWSCFAGICCILVPPVAAAGRGDLLKLAEQTLSQSLPAAGRDNASGNLAWGDSYAMQAYVELLVATGDERFADRMIKHANLVLAVTDEKLGRKDAYRNKLVPAWGSVKYSKNKNYVWAVHTGMIAYPMARFAAIVRRDDGLKQRYGVQADRLLKAAERAVAVHDKDYRDGPADDEGHLYGPFLKKHLPLNQQNILVEAWMALDQASGEAKHKEQIKRLARFFKRRLRLTEDDCYVWDYWPPADGPGTGAEDISHAAINVDFAALLYDRKIIFDRNDIKRFCNTFTRRVFPSADRIADTVAGDGHGKYERSVLRWGRLAKSSRQVRSRLVDYAASLKAPLAAPDLLGVAYLISALSDQ